MSASFKCGQHRQRDMGSLIGQTIGGFTIESIIGKGSFSTVYRVRPQGLRRSYAMKIPNEATPEARTRLEREVQLLDRASNEHIPQIIAQDVNGDMPYAVLEEVPDSLQDILKNTQPYWDKKVEYAAQILDALDYAHNVLNVVHRDVAPKNIRLNRDTVKLVDFDLSLEQKVVDIERSNAGNEPQNFTGTRKYASPEQQGMTDAKVGPAADVFSVGVMLYEMLTGEFPAGEMPPLSTKGLPKWLDRIDAKARAKLPQDRSTAAEMAKALRQGLEGKFDGPKFMPRVRRLAGEGASCLLTGILVAGIGVGCFYGVRGCYRYLTADSKAQERFVEELRRDDSGKIAYIDDSEKGLVRTVNAQSLDKPKSHKLGDLKINGLLWNADGTRLYYLEDTGLIAVVHRINEYDLATAKKRTILDLSDKKKTGLGGDDIEDWSILHAQDGDRILFKLCDGKWHSVLPTGTGLQAETGAPVGDNQGYCPSTKHWVRVEGDEVRVYNGENNYYKLGTGKSPVWSPK